VRQALRYDPIPLYDHHDDRYSNAGYIAASLMLEKANGKTWEEMIMEISDDLNLNLHIGWPKSFSQNEPQGHINPEYWIIDMEKELIPIPLELRSYHYFNQCILLCTPSGHLSIPISGFLEFLKLHIQGLNGEDNYLKSSTYRHLMTSYDDYSLGWACRLFDQTCYHHRGSAGTFSSIAMIFPESNLGIVIMVNTYNGEGLDEIAWLLIEKYQ
jgi:CubicO group peptidase (beta-lactamase class C family)